MKNKKVYVTRFAMLTILILAVVRVLYTICIVDMSLLCFQASNFNIQ